MLLIFWDYDGTLVETETVYRDSLESFFEKNNYLIRKIPDKYFYKNISGKHPEEFLDGLKTDGFIKSDADIDPNETKKYYTKYFKELENGKIKITKDIDMVIDDLSANKNVIMCITSSSFIHDFKIKRDNVNNKILNSNFDIEKNIYMCGSIEGCNFKPAPDIFIYALNDLTKKHKLKLGKNDTILVIEDSPTGCKAGNAFKDIYDNKINVEVIWYLSGSHIDTDNELVNSGACTIAKNAKELNKIIKSFL